MTSRIEGDRILLLDIADREIKQRLIYECFATPFKNCNGVSVHLSQLNDINRITGAKLEFPKHTEKFDVPYLTSPFLHQHKTSQKALRFDKFAILSGTGTGKAKSCIDIARYRFANGQASKALVVCPKSNICTWQEQIMLHSGEPSVPLLAASTAKRKLILDRMRDSRWYVINYESIPLMEIELIETFKGNNIVIFDESTKITSPRARRTLSAVRIAQSMKYALIATGNIAADSPLDLYCQYFIVDGGSAFGCPKSGDVKHGFFSFRLKFFSPGFQNWSWKPKPFALKYFSTAMGLRGIRFKLNDCVDIPATQNITIPLELPPELRAPYDEMKQNLMLELASEGKTVSVKTALAKCEKLRQIISGFIYSTETGTAGKQCSLLAPSSPKLEALLGIIEESTCGIFCWVEYDQDARYVAEFLDKHKITNVSILVGAKPEEIDAAIKGVGSKHRVIITKPRIMGWGHTVLNAPISVYFSRYYWNEPYSQSHARSLRIGQTQKVIYYDLVYKDTIDATIQRILDSKLKLEKEISPSGIEELV
jgi:hypothetical protein